MRAPAFVSALICLLLFAFVTPARAASIVVNTLNDTTGIGGTCSLREAITAANSALPTFNGCNDGGGADTIQISLPGTYTLNGSALPTITSTITIQPLFGSVIIEAAASENSVNHNVFNVGTNGNLTLNNLTIRHGGSDGFGGVGGCVSLTNDDAALTVTNSTIERCHTGWLGGGIGSEMSGHSITITDSTIRDNVAAFTGGGVISSQGELTLTNATLTGNRASGEGNGMGGAIGFFGLISDSATYTLRITGGVFSGNEAQFEGGAIVGDGNLLIDGTTFSSNSADNGGGIHWNAETASGISIEDSVFINNSANDALFPRGGGTFIEAGSVTIKNTRYEFNDAAFGSAIFSLSDSSFFILDSCITKNTGRAIYNAAFTAPIFARDNWWGSSWGPQMLNAGGGSAVSSGDRVEGDVSVGLTSSGTPTTSPSGDWLTTAPTVAGSPCQNQTLPYDVAELTVTVPFQARPPAPNPLLMLPMTVILKPTAGGAAAVNTTFSTDQNSMLTIENIPASVNTGYTLWVKGAHTLARSQVVSLQEGSNTATLNAALREGDANGDNTVTLPDFSLLASAFGSTGGQGNYNAAADFNGDGSVSLIDFSLLASNFGTAGAAIP